MLEAFWRRWGGDFHGGNVPVIGGTRRDKGGCPGIFFQVGRKIRIVFIILGGDVHRNASQVETKFHKRYFWEVWVVGVGADRGVRPYGVVSRKFPIMGGGAHGPRPTGDGGGRGITPPLRGVARDFRRGDGRKRGDGMPSPRLGFLLSLGFAQPMMLPYWSTMTLVPSGRVIA